MIEFVEVSQDNWRECINLPTSEAHRFVASNLYSIAEAQFYPKAHACCIYAEGQMVGFTMYGIDEDDERMMVIDRLMIGEPFRGRGYGVAAVRKIVEEAKALGMQCLGLSVEPDNLVAKHVYEKVGFAATGLMDGDEEIYRYTLEGETHDR
jgi:diamine N-acetyltransferase